MSEPGVGLDKQKLLWEKMCRLGVLEADIKENFTRSSGPGGQHVNKTSTCVHLKHLPSGIEVRCQEERAQGKNRYIARKRLLEKIENFILGKASLERQRIEKVRRQKRKRSKRAKMKVLEAKRRHAQKKLLRGPVSNSE